MLWDRIKWHFDPNVNWNDPDAAMAYIPSGQQTAVRAATSFRYDLTDHAEFQRPDPQWTPPPGLRGMVVRCTDGTYREPAFATDFRIMDGLLQQGLLDYCMWYVLPNPNVSNQQMLSAIAGQMKDSGVTWGRKGHGISIDDEPTPYHAQLTGQRMIDLRNALADTYQREELHYVGLYNGNYGFIENQGWKLWAPWPTGNGALPSWTTNLVMQQWGVAAPGEVPGFPNAPVDVDHIWDQATLDALTGRTQQEDDFLSALSSDQQQQLFNAVMELQTQQGLTAAQRQQQFNAVMVLRDRSGLDAAQQQQQFNSVYATEQTAAASQKAILDLAQIVKAGGTDVDALAKALAPLLNEGADPKATARAILEYMGSLATGGTPSGST